jgi:Putative amidoligase enzyme
MPQTWNKWIRREFARVTADAQVIVGLRVSTMHDPSYPTVAAYWEHFRRGAPALDISIGERDSIAYNMARVVWLAQEITATPPVTYGWRLRNARTQASDRFNFTLVPVGRQAGLNVRASRSRHGDAAWNIQRMRWLEAQVGHLLDHMAAQPGSQTAVRIAQPAINGVPFVPMLLNTDDLTFGVEIECIHPRDMSQAALATHITEGGQTCRSELYNHTVRSGWKIVHDGSVSSQHGSGCEIVSPVLRGEAGFDAIRQVCAVLSDKLGGALGSHAINRTCGLHVHIGMRGQAVQLPINLLRIYNRFEPVIDSVLSASRRSNNYCRPTLFNAHVAGAQNFDQLRRHYGFDRFRKVNLESYWRHGTIEFRQHQGTIEAEKIINWVKFCQRLFAVANTAPELSDEPPALDNLLTLINADASEREYFLARQNHFATGGDD